MEQRQSFQQMVLEQLDIHMQKKQKKKSIHSLNLLHKYQLKIDHRSEFNTYSCEMSQA